MTSKWDWGPGDVQVYESINDMPARDPDMAFSLAQYQGIIDALPDPDGRALCQSMFDREDWVLLNDALIDPAVTGLGGARVAPPDRP